MRAVGASGICAGQRVLVLSPTPTHPQDYGNRKRIFEICKRFCDEGAHLTFVHYPAELEWRKILPVNAERAMRDCWDQYYTVGPTRPLHTDPEQQEHRIDEWFDAAIGEFLRWLFSVQSFDIFIVNYSWLSKALEFAPPRTFKILDTHDKVSGRREMLASLGLGPEFFHTTDAEEAVALRRADLVWAIKDEERALFERMAPTPVLTMQHLDPGRALERAVPDADGVLRVGIIGARNNINRINITEFLNIALPIFASAFAPVRIVIAGTVCELLNGLDSPFVELRGPVESVEDFYRTVDCVAVPMRASTGLKIKAGEAISLGLPLLSLSHAFEGYEPTDPLHALGNFEDLANALVELSFAPRERLDTLAKASAVSHAKTGANITASFNETIARSRAAASSIVLAIDSRAFVTGSIFSHILNSVHENLRQLGQVTVLVVRGSAHDVVSHPQSIDRFDRVLVASDLPDAEEMRGALARLSADVANVAAFFAHAKPKLLIAEALHPALMSAVLPETVVISRDEVIAWTEGKPAPGLADKRFKRVFASAPGPSAAPLPIFLASPPAKVRAARLVRERRTVALLGRPGSAVVAMAASMATAWGLEPLVICGLEDDPRVETPNISAPAMRADAFVASLYAYRAPRPHFALDLSGGRPGLLLCREVLERLRVPLVSCSGIGMHRALRGDGMPLKAGSEAELWAAVRGFALEPDAVRNKMFQRGWDELEWGRGWAWLWRNSKELFAASHAEQR